MNSSAPLIRQRVRGWPLNSRDSKFQRRCLELKTYIEAKGELPRFTSKSEHLARWLSNLANGGGLTKPDKRAMLESLHPLVAELVEQQDSRTIIKVNHPIWQRKLQRLVAWVQENGQLPYSACSETGLYDWFCRNIRTLQRLPQELVKELYDSHPLIAAKVRAAQAKRVERGLSQKEESGPVGT